MLVHVLGLCFPLGSALALVRVFPLPRLLIHHHLTLVQSDVHYVYVCVGGVDGFYSKSSDLEW